MRWLRFVLAGLYFALAVEIFYKFFAGLNPSAFGIAVIFYLIWLQPLYWLHVVLDSRARRAHWIFFLASGALGLLVLEWGLVGNTPRGNPNASQLGMFLFHAVYPFMSRLFSDRSVHARRLQRAVLKYFAIFVAICSAGILIPNGFLRFAWFIYFPLLGYAGLAWFGWRYVRGIPERTDATTAASV